MKINPRAALVRESIAKIVTMLSFKKIRVVTRGTAAYVEYNKENEPVLVSLPSVPDDATNELIDAVQGFLDHEVGHVLYSDVKWLRDACGEVAETRAPNSSQQKMVEGLMRCLEDVYIEKMMAENFPGCGANLAGTGSFFLKNRVIPDLAKTQPEHRPFNLLMPLVRTWGGQPVFADFMRDKMDEVKRWTEPVGEDVGTRVRALRSSEDVFNLAFDLAARICKKAEEDKKEESKGEKGEDEGEGERCESGAPSPRRDDSDDDEDDDEDDSDDDEPATGMCDEPGEGERDKESHDDDDDEDDEDEADDHDGDEGVGRPEDEDEDEAEDEGEGKSRHEAKERVKGEDDHHREDYDCDDEGAIEALTPEEMKKLLEATDYDGAIGKIISEACAESAAGAPYLVFTTDEDKVEPLVAPKNSAVETLTKAMQERCDHMLAPMQKDIERAVAARSAATWTGGHRSGRIHGASLMRVATGRDDIFRRKQDNTSKDVAVSLVIDASSSMQGPEIRTACEAAYAVSAVLDRLSIKNEVIAFTTKHFSYATNKAQNDEGARLAELGHHVRYSRDQAIYMPLLKQFDERMTPEVRRRLAFMSSGAGVLNQNIDGESILIAARRLAARRETRKVMMVFSDGCPACPGDMHAQSEHMKAAVKQIEASGTDVLGIGIDSSAVKAYYARNLVLSNVKDLPGVVMKELKARLLK